ncbi:MAG: methyltransferase domain-containing protein [Alphaproteobacteria bacterium]
MKGKGDSRGSGPGEAWSEDDSAGFLDHGRYFVPERETQIATICAAVPATAEPVHLVELCCGGGLLSRALLERLPNAALHAFDGSPAMLKAAGRRCAAFGDRFAARAFDLAARDWRAFPWPLHAALSSLAIHHLDGPQKRRLFKDIAAALAPGGVLAIADIVEPATAAGWG